MMVVVCVGGWVGVGWSGVKGWGMVHKSAQPHAPPPPAYTRTHTGAPCRSACCVPPCAQGAAARRCRCAAPCGASPAAGGRRAAAPARPEGGGCSQHAPSQRVPSRPAAALKGAPSAAALRHFARLPTAPAGACACGEAPPTPHPTHPPTPTHTTHRPHPPTPKTAAAPTQHQARAQRRRGKKGKWKTAPQSTRLRHALVHVQRAHGGGSLVGVGVDHRQRVRLQQLLVQLIHLRAE